MAPNPQQLLAQARLAKARANPRWTEIPADLVPRALGQLVAAGSDQVYMRHPGVVWEPGTATVISEYTPLCFYVADNVCVFVDPTGRTWSEITRKTAQGAGMSVTALIRLAPLWDGQLQLDRTVYQRGTFKGLSPDTVIPVVVNHDDARVVGHVREFDYREDSAGGMWCWAYAELHDPPGWVSRNTACSFSFKKLQAQNIGDHERILRMIVTEVSILPPNVQPVEPRARVAWLGPTQTDQPAAGETIVASPSVIRRYFETTITVR